MYKRFFLILRLSPLLLAIAAADAVAAAAVAAVTAIRMQ